MTTTDITNRYEILDSYIDRIVDKIQDVGDLIKECLATAKEHGISEEEAKKYLKSKIPKTTFYRYLEDKSKRTYVTTKKEDTVADTGNSPTWDSLEKSQHLQSSNEKSVPQAPEEPEPKQPEPERQTLPPVDEIVAKVNAQARTVVNRLEEQLGDLTKENQANKQSAKMWCETAKRRQKENDDLRNKQTKQEEKLNGGVKGRASVELIRDIWLELKCSYNPNAQTTQKFCVVLTPESQNTVDQIFARLK